MTGSLDRRMTAAEWGTLLTLSVLWGGSFFFVEIAVKELPPVTLVLLRVGLAAAALWLVVAARGLPVPRDRGIWGAFLVMGLLNNALPFTLFGWGQTQIASGLASILNATTPLFGVLAAHVMTRDEKMTAPKLFGVVAGLAGVAAMVGGEALEGFGSGFGSGIAAQIACLAAALSYAVAGVYGRRFHDKGVDPLVTATGQVTASSVILLPVMLLVDRPWSLPMPSVLALAAVAGLALLSTAVAYILYFRLLASAGATNILLVTFLIPVTAILLGVLFLGEALEPRHLVGMALIGLGLAAIDGRVFAGLRRLAA